MCLRNISVRGNIHEGKTLWCGSCGRRRGERERIGWSSLRLWCGLEKVSAGLMRGASGQGFPLQDCPGSGTPTVFDHWLGATWVEWAPECCGRMWNCNGQKLSAKYLPWSQVFLERRYEWCPAKAEYSVRYSVSSVQQMPHHLMLLIFCGSGTFAFLLKVAYFSFLVTVCF